jgi:competence protein ComEA
MYRVVCTLIMALACPFALGQNARNFDVNLATQAELEQLRGVGPQLSERILTARQDRPFTDWDDLRGRVSGLGPVQTARLSREGLTVAGSAFAATDSMLTPLRQRKRGTKN